MSQPRISLDISRSPLLPILYHYPLEKPLPALALPVGIAPHAMIFLLSLLDHLDTDVQLEVARVQESINETRAFVEACKSERQAQRR